MRLEQLPLRQPQEAGLHPASGPAQSVAEEIVVDLAVLGDVHTVPVALCGGEKPIGTSVMVTQQMCHFVHPDPREFGHGCRMDEGGRGLAAPVPVDSHRLHFGALHDDQGVERRRKVGPFARRPVAGGEQLGPVQWTSGFHHAHRPHRLPGRAPDICSRSRKLSMPGGTG
jgi:hypothetical protein